MNVLKGKAPFLGADIKYYTYTYILKAGEQHPKQKHGKVLKH